MWETEIVASWSKLRSQGGFTWSCWSVKVLTPEDKAQHGRAGPQDVLMGVTDHEAEWQVTDGNGAVVMVTRHEHLARLVAAFPETFEPDLRPGETLRVRGDDGLSKVIPQAESIGIMSPQQVYDSGYKQGWSNGSADMERTIEADKAEDEKERSECTQ
jgi:hypothetical protein